MCTVRYISETDIPMIGKFIFVLHNQTLYRIIQFSQEKFTCEYTVIFKAIVETIEFNNVS